MGEENVREMHLEDKVRIDSEGKVLLLPSPIVRNVVKERGRYYIKDKFLIIYVFGTDYDACVNEYKKTLYNMWNDYVMEPGKSKDAQDMKSKLRSIIAEVGDI
jgi:hypothetical protein